MDENPSDDAKKPSKPIETSTPVSKKVDNATSSTSQTDKTPNQPKL